MFINCHYDHRKSQMNIWEEIKGERFFDRVDWVPYVFENVQESPIKTIFGQPVIKRVFKTYGEYYQYQKENICYENSVKPEIQFLSERYSKIPDDEMGVPRLKIYSLDIEVANEGSFPDIWNAVFPINLISITDNITGKTVSFGEKQYTGSQPILYCQYREAELLLRFLNFMYKRPPDILTGWNVYHFDLAYLIQRCRKLFGEETQHIHKLSPIKIVKTWKAQNYDDLNIDIAGVHIIDYLDLYKWYCREKLERYSLDFVCKHELGEGKVVYQYDDLRELAEKDWNTFVEYNVKDSQLVDQLERKLGYIRLVQALSLLTKCPMKFYQSMTHLIEGALLTHFRRNNLCAPYLKGGHQEHYPAAFCKEPQKGMHSWVVDFDIASSYPTAIITLNMSSETYFGRILDFTDDQMVNYVRTRKFPEFSMLKDDKSVLFLDDKLDKFNQALERGLFAIAPCGSVFKTNPIGELAKVERAIFYKRKDVKSKMKEMEIMAQGDTNPKWKERALELFSLQWAIKIILNAVYGITAVPYSRYFNVNIAEAITSCGRHTIKMGEKFVNEWFLKFAEIDEDMVAYIDTDSLFIRLGHYFQGMEDWENGDDAKKIEIILSFSKQLEDYVNQRSFEETQLKDYNSQIHDFKIIFEQEIIAKRALFVKKKKYAYWEVPSNKLAVKGLEIVRSDSAEAIRIRLRHIYELIMKGATDDELVDMILKYKKELKKVPPEEIAANIGVNNIDKYLSGDNSADWWYEDELDDLANPKKGTPWHVKGVHNYRKLLDILNLKNKYEDILEGSKSRVVYLKSNKFAVDILTYQVWPHEFNDHLQIDYEKMIEKFFLKKISFLLEPMGKLELLNAGKRDRMLNCWFE